MGDKELQKLKEEMNVLRSNENVLLDRIDNLDKELKEVKKKAEYAYQYAPI